MRFIALLGSIVIVTLTVLLVLKSTEPQLYLKIALTFDFIGFSGDASAEKDRLEHIDLLPISQQKKDILINRTIFLGATSTMVELALGKPLSKTEADPLKPNAKMQWMYHFQKDMLPTALEFEQNRLVSAQTMNVTMR